MANQSIITQLCPRLLGNSRVEGWLGRPWRCERPTHHFPKRGWGGKPYPLGSPLQGDLTWPCVGGSLAACLFRACEESEHPRPRWFSAAAWRSIDSWGTMLLNSRTMCWARRFTWDVYTKADCLFFLHLVLNLERFCMSLYRVIHSSHCLS